MKTLLKSYFILIIFFLNKINKFVEKNYFSELSKYF